MAKTPEELAQTVVNKRVANALADIEIERRKLKAEIKKLDKREKKILDGELVPGDISVSDDDDDDEDNESSSAIKVKILLDESGSMSSCKDQTISGFNEYINALKKEKKKVTVTLTKFGGDRVNVVYTNKDAKKVPALTSTNYSPSGMTPLYDAIGRTIGEDKGRKGTLFVIMTDGYENASHEYNQSAIVNLIKEQEKVGWTFVYLGADQDAWAHSQQLGLSRGNTLSYNSLDTRATFNDLSNHTIAFCSTGGKSTKKFWGQKNE